MKSVSLYLVLFSEIVFDLIISLSCNDNNVRVWNINSVELLFNDVLLSVGDDKTLKIWSSKTIENDNDVEIIYNKNEKNIFKASEFDFEKDFLETMNEPIEEIPVEEENAEESDEEEERAGEIRLEGEI